MSSNPWAESWVVRAAIAGAVLGLVGFACITHDHPRPTCSALADGGTPLIGSPDALNYKGLPTTDAEAPTEMGIAADPGPACTNCQQGDGFELMPIADFEQAFAPGWINFGEPGAKLAPQQVGLAPDQPPGGEIVPKPYWGLQVVDLRTLAWGTRCGNNYALHLQGGRFASWGGGYATLYATVRGAEPLQRYCPPDLVEGPTTTGGADVPAPVEDTCGFWMTPVEATQPARLGLDASMFEGIALWARRGPGGQPPLRVAVQDGNTSAGFALAVERDLYRVEHEGAESVFGKSGPACRRIVSCCLHCNEVERDVLLYATVDGKQVPSGIGHAVEKRCHKPGEREPPRLREGGPEGFEFQEPVSESKPLPDAGDAGEHPWLSVGAEGTAYEAAFDDYEREIKLCCPKTMAEDPENGDPQFGGKECTEYVFHYDGSSGRYCRNLDDPPLPEKNQNRCGDGFESSIVLDTEWRLFRIPWSELRRATLNQPAIEPRGIAELDLYFGPGWLDTYVDDVGFYRKRP